MKILFFLESLYCGGKERRSLELIQYLKQQNYYDILLVLTEKEIYYKYVYELGVNIEIIKRKVLKYDPRLFIKFYRCCRRFKPDIIHTWGNMTTFYAIPTKLICRIPLISNLIGNSRRTFAIFSLEFCFFKADIFFSNIILSNSKSGLTAYNIKTPKAKVIHNGVQLKRFKKKFDAKKVKEKLGIDTQYMLVMVASFSKYKDYDFFIDVAKELGKIRSDVTLIGIGEGSNWKHIQKRINDEKIHNVILTGIQTEVENIIAASEIGLLYTYSEGISNSILEYMALGKPVITTDVMGGTKEVIIQGKTGYYIKPNVDRNIELINLLLNDVELRTSMGKKGEERVNSYFSIDRMGNDFEVLYKEVLAIQSKSGGL